MEKLFFVSHSPPYYNNRVKNNKLTGLMHRIQQSWLVRWTFRPLLVLVFLYLFVCSLDLLSSAFQLLGGKAAGRVFQQNEYLKNPVCGLMIGVLSTVLVQSSSTSTSIVVTMVANGLLTVPLAIPIIFGANIGTSVTNTIVSLAQGSNRDEFRRAFAGATVHDAFNWLTVLVMLPLEVLTGFLYNATKSIVDSLHPELSPSALKDAVVAASAVNNTTTKGKSGGGGGFNLLGAVTKPFTSSIIQLDKQVIEAVATGDASSANRSLIKQWCSWRTVSEIVNTSTSMSTPDATNEARTVIVRKVGDQPCRYLMRYISTSETVVGVVLLIVSIIMLVGCLMCVVKVLNAMLKGSVAKNVQKYVNEDLPGPFAYFTNWAALVIGAIITVLLQSSSVFTSTLTPLVGIGMVSLERKYPLTLGSNVGTCGTGLLAALSASGNVAKLKPALHIALCHLFFNLSGIALFFPVPFMRFPVTIARLLGNTTAKYKWFAVFYIVLMFFALPLFVFLLSLNMHVLYWIGGPLLVLFLLVIFVNVLQRQMPLVLPPVLRTWKFLPHWLHSLKPVDYILRRVFACCPQSCLQVCCEAAPSDDDDDDDVNVASGVSGVHAPTTTPSPSSARRASIGVDKNVIIEDDDDSDMAGGIVMQISPSVAAVERIERNINEKSFSNGGGGQQQQRASRSHDMYNIKRQDRSSIYRPVPSREPSTDRDSNSQLINNSTNNNKKARKTRRTLNLLRLRQHDGNSGGGGDAAELQGLSSAVVAIDNGGGINESSFTSGKSAAAVASLVNGKSAPFRQQHGTAAVTETVAKSAAVGPSTRSIAAMVSATIKHNQEPLKSTKQQHYGGPLRHSFHDRSQLVKSADGHHHPHQAPSKLPHHKNPAFSTNNSDTESRRHLLLTSAGSSAAASYASIAEYYNNSMWPAGSTTLTSASSSEASSQVPSRAPSCQRIDKIQQQQVSPTISTSQQQTVDLVGSSPAPPLAADRRSCTTPNDDLLLIMSGSTTLSNKSSNSTTSSSILAHQKPPPAASSSLSPGGVVGPKPPRNITVHRVLSNVSSTGSSTAAAHGMEMIMPPNKIAATTTLPMASSATIDQVRERLESISNSIRNSASNGGCNTLPPLPSDSLAYLGSSPLVEQKPNPVVAVFKDAAHDSGLVLNGADETEKVDTGQTA